MGNHDRTEQTLTLLARRGVYEALSAIHANGGNASFAQISAVFPQPIALLRAMAVEGFLISPRGGSLDLDPCADTDFCLTRKGEAIFGRLVRLRRWMDSRRLPN